MANKITGALPIGSILQSPQLDYRIEQVLGQGGFGITYKVSAEIILGNIPVTTHFAIKEHFLSDCCERENDTKINVSRTSSNVFADSMADFKTEANRLKSLSGKHKGIVRVNEVFPSNNTVYYVMEFLNGDSLRTYVKKNGPLKESEAISIMKKVCGAISFLHEKHIAHLDIKPDNIILNTHNGSQQTEPVLIDFGLSKHYDSKGHPTSTIRTRGCSEGYSPMEQYVGIDHFTPTADIYSLGATLFYLLTGKDPVIASNISEEYIKRELPENVTEETKRVILLAMKKNREDRLQNIKSFNFETISFPEDESNKTKVLRIGADKGGFSKKKKHFITAVMAICALLFGFFLTDIINMAKPEESIAEQKIFDQNVEELTAEEPETEIAEPIAESEEIAQIENVPVNTDVTDKLTEEYEKYLAEADRYTNEGESQCGNKSAIQMLLNAKYYYYDKAGTLYRELNGSKIPVNHRLDSIVTHEFEYWVQQGDKQGKNKANFAMKKQYYERAYMLRENKTIKARIDWLNDKLDKNVK